MRRTPEEIDRERRRFPGAVAFALAAAQLGLIPSASAKSGMSDEPGVRPETSFPGFSAESVNTSGTTIHVLRKGTGRPLLLLHGYPETHLTWYKVAAGGRILRRRPGSPRLWPVGQARRRGTA